MVVTEYNNTQKVSERSEDFSSIFDLFHNIKISGRTIIDLWDEIVFYSFGLSNAEMQRAKLLETGNIAATYLGATVGGSILAPLGPFGGMIGAYGGATIANEVYDWTVYQFYRLRYNP